MISDFTDFFQYRIFLLPRCTAIHPVFLCTVCSIINSSSRQHKTLTPWPDAFSRKISFYIFRVTRRKRTASNSFFFFFIFLATSRYLLQIKNNCASISLLEKNISKSFRERRGKDRKIMLEQKS